MDAQGAKKSAKGNAKPKPRGRPLKEKGDSAADVSSWKQDDQTCIKTKLATKSTCQESSKNIPASKGAVCGRARREMPRPGVGCGRNGKHVHEL
jgi:hypothetical protein